MPLDIDRSRLQAALDKARNALLGERNARGHWTGELSSSALSTATAVCALQIVGRETGSLDRFQSVIHHGLRWLSDKQNSDGGWGDTDLSFSNISTTTLCWAAFGVVPGADERHAATVAKSEKWLRAKAGGLAPDQLADTIIKRYGKDRTFSVPILTMCALSGRFGDGPEAWKRVIALPFELAAFPQGMFAALRLPVVSYALPALIAIGQARHRHAPSRNPLARVARHAACERTLKVLECIQPTNGGFLEATPLTSFVTMSLAASGLVEHPVVLKGVEFLLASMRVDGSWAIDTNLATWVTTLSVNALANDPSFQLPPDERASIREWLLGQQYRTVHPYTGAAPGGWAWTDLPGGVPDADDTAGALLALKNLSVASVCDRRTESATLTERRYNIDGDVREAAAQGVKWLLDLQNRDGGMPTFCRGWTNLPFDKSSSDITAHSIRAWLAWENHSKPGQAGRFLVKARKFLLAASLDDNYAIWAPLWFGDQHSNDELNLAYGTAKVIQAINEFPNLDSDEELTAARDGAIANLGYMQRSDGSWGGGYSGGPASVEETSVILESLLAGQTDLSNDGVATGESPAATAASWLISRVESNTWTQPAPIGFYFAKLWYYEKLYPMIFTVGALSKVKALMDRA